MNACPRRIQGHFRKAKDVPFLTTGIKMSFMWGKIRIYAREDLVFRVLKVCSKY
jgi:hypothetical protein